MLLNDLKQFVIDEITVGGALPLKLSDKELERIITNETEIVYSLYREAITNRYVILPYSLFRTSTFRQNRTFQLPSCVTGIADLREMKSNTMFFGLETGDRDITFEKALQADIWMNINGGDLIAAKTIQWSMWDQMKNFILKDIQFKFNPNTHRLLILGHDPQNNVFVNMFVKVPDNELWEDPWVKRFICAKAKSQMAKNLGLFTTTLLGGTQVNYQLLQTEADNDYKECKEFFDKTNVPDFFLDFP